MPSPTIDTKAVRYAASFLVLLAAIALGTLAAVAVPESLAYHGIVEKALILVAAALGVYGMLRIEEGPGPIARRLR